MPDRKTRALLTIVLALAASIGFVWWRRASHVDPPASMVFPTSASEPAAGTTAPNLTSPVPAAARAAKVVPPPVDKPNPPSASGAPPELAGGGLWLHLIDSRGESKSGVQLEVTQDLWLTLGSQHPDKNFVEELVTDASGRARIASKHVSEIETVCLPRRRLPSLVVNLPFELAAGHTDEVLLLYPEPVTVRGRVFDLSGAPVTTRTRVDIEGCPVVADSAGVHAFVAEESSTYVDDEGRFAFKTTAGWHALVATVTGKEATETVRVHVGPESVTDIALFVAKPERTVRVHLVCSEPCDPSSANVSAVGDVPWPDVTKVAGAALERVREKKVVQATHVDGAWQLKLARVGKWTVQAGGPDFDLATRELLPDADEITLTILPKPRRAEVVFTGRVVDANGKPPTDLTIVQLLRMSDLFCPYGWEAAPDGTFRMLVSEVFSDETQAYVFAQRGDEQSGGIGPISLAHSRDNLEIVLRPGLEITGRVNGLPSGVEANITLYSQPSRFEHAEVPATSEWLPSMLEGGEWGFHTYDGEFSVNGMPAGEYQLWVVPQDGITPPARQRVTAGDENVVVELGRGLEGGLTLVCRVVNDITGAPIVGAEVRLEGEYPVRARGSSGRTDAMGMCRLAGHVAGRWFVVAHAPRFAFLPAQMIDLEESEQFVELRLSPVCTLDLQFHDSSGTPRSSVSAYATTLQGDILCLQDRYGTVGWGMMQSDASGRIVADGLPVGRVRIVVGWKDGARVDIRDSSGVGSLENPRELLVFEHVLELGKRTIVRRELP